ncbi:MAG: hypothetical protein DRI32_09535 [Chloroflexi bacterium]|nr:MAG: hypothetical protein DRI32_09535 [Chloroflexota bacterium]
MGRKKRKIQTRGIYIFLLIWSFTIFNTGSVSAAPNPPGPDRFTAITVEYTSYEWWLLRWGNSEVVCEINIEHEGLPTLGEVYVDCGETLYTAWIEQEACPVDIYKEDSSQCPGYYLHFNTSTLKDREVAIALPPPVVWIDLENCVVDGTTNRCDLPPTLVLRGDEPLAREEITSINGESDGESFSCDSASCNLPLSETDDGGITLSFWATSSYGDSSSLFNARLRVSLVEDEEKKAHFWYVDILSSQWRGEANASCAETWDTFPPVGGAPLWLTTPDDISELQSDISYAYLAGNLISNGIVDASQCLDFGIDENGEATTCGIEVAQPAMTEWQNRFDASIMEAAGETSIPALLLKRLFARESQFWPGVFNAGTDVGFGQLTDQGADIAFLWNPSFFEKFCSLVLEDDICNEGYLGLDIAQQERLRGALVYSVNATCEECPLGLDLTQADYSVGVFANTLLGSCEQTGSVVYNNTAKSPGVTTSYEDLWKFTLVNYNAGAGCLSLAIGKTLDKSEPLDWNHLSENLTAVCMGTKDYVEDISGE